MLVQDEEYSRLGSRLGCLVNQLLCRRQLHRYRAHSHLLVVAARGPQPR